MSKIAFLWGLGLWSVILVLFVIFSIVDLRDGQLRPVGILLVLGSCGFILTFYLYIRRRLIFINVKDTRLEKYELTPVFGNEGNLISLDDVPSKIGFLTFMNINYAVYQINGTLYFAIPQSGWFSFYGLFWYSSHRGESK